MLHLNFQNLFAHSLCATFDFRRVRYFNTFFIHSFANDFPKIRRRISVLWYVDFAAWLEVKYGLFRPYFN